MNYEMKRKRRLSGKPPIKYAFGFYEQIKNNKESDTTDWIKREKNLGQRYQKRVPVGLGFLDDTKAFFNKTKDDATNLFNKTTSDANDFITKVKYGRTDLSPKVKSILNQHGTATILYARVGRKPITSAI